MKEGGLLQKEAFEKTALFSVIKDAVMTNFPAATENINTADTGHYQLKTFSNGKSSEKTFIVTVLDAPDADLGKGKIISAMEGESVTLDPDVIKNTSNVMMWYFNDTLIAVMTGDQSKICTDDQCRERFRDRLKLDHQTGSLIITNTRTTDSGLYKLQINSSIPQHSVSITSLKRFILTVIDSGLSSAAVAGICVCAVLLFVLTSAAGVIYYHKRHQAGENDPPAQSSDQSGRLEDLSPNLSDPMLMDSANETSPDGNETEAAIETSH
ncbi:hypothetical protein QQF64_019559 [Cirrhinus molitorella]|uniref:Uncharacterized protein n=1 Tax=Cirrhinus molitorella TaxID=172907 RepID=A0ABR3LJV9_9TELE